MSNSNFSSSQTSTSSSTSTTPSPARRGLVGRIIAVTLFLGLGTFAVSQSLISKGDDSEVAKHEKEEKTETSLQVKGNDDEKTQSQANQTPKLDLNKGFKPTIKSDLNSELTSSNSSLPKSQPQKPFQTQPFSPIKKNDPVVAPVTTPKSNSLQASNGNSPLKSAFNSQPNQTLNTSVPKFDPKSFPQTGNKSPVLSSLGDSPKTNGSPLGQLKFDPPPSVTQKVNDAAGEAVKKTDEFAKQTVNQARNEVAKTTNSLKDPLQLNPNPSPSTAPKVAPIVSTATPRQANSATQQAFNQLPKGSDGRDAGFNAKALPPITTNGLRGFNNNRPNENAQVNSAPVRQAPKTNPTSNPTTNFQSRGAANLPPIAPATNPSRNPTPLNNGPNSFANNSGSFNSTSNSLTNNPRQMPTRAPAMPTTQERRSTIPAMQASTTRLVAPVTSGVLTLPTPGETDLEGTRTPSVTVQRIAPREIQLNTPASFEIIVKNTGRIEANDVRVYDQVPTGTQLLEASPQPSVNDGKSLQWHIGKLAPGQERQIKLKLRPTQPGEIGSVAHVTFATRSSVRTLVTKPELTITHAAPARSLIGDNVRLDIVVTNKGNGPATDVVVQEEIPSQLEYPDGFRRIEYPVGTLVPGQSRKLQLNLKAANVGRLKNIVQATAAGNLNAQHSVDMEIVAPKLLANANGPRRRYLRRQATHEFGVQNNGTAAATNVEMMAKMPPGLKFVSANNQGQYDSATHAVYWALNRLEPGTPVSVSLTSVPVDTGNQDIEFTAVADLKQKVNASAGLVVEHLVDVFFDIDDLVDHIEIGSDTKYQLRVVNQGTKTATNIRLNVEFPMGIRPKNVEGGLESQIQGQRVAFAPITSMNPGDEIKVAINAIGAAPGEHKVVARMSTDGRQTNVAKEETTQVYSDR